MGRWRQSGFCFCRKVGLILKCQSKAGWHGHRTGGLGAKRRTGARWICAFPRDFSAGWNQLIREIGSTLRQGASPFSTRSLFCPLKIRESRAWVINCSGTQINSHICAYLSDLGNPEALSFMARSLGVSPSRIDCPQASRHCGRASIPSRRWKGVPSLARRREAPRVPRISLIVNPLLVCCWARARHYIGGVSCALRRSNTETKLCPTSRKSAGRTRAVLFF